MRLIAGPSGSGKTARVLDEFRAALQSGNQQIRLLAPTATLVQHLQNQLAREGFVFRPGLIQTLSGFIEPWVTDAPAASDPVLYLVVEEAARRVNRPEFARVLHLPGFSASLAGTISEFASAGCSSARLEGCLPDAPLAAAFVAVYREVDHELERRGLALRGRRLELAAARIEAEGAGDIRTIWLDGFHALPDPELRVIQALSRHAEVTVTWGEHAVPGIFLGRYTEPDIFLGRHRVPAPRHPAVALFRAPGIEREAEEIARRILEQAGAGRPFREMGVIVRPAGNYVPVLRAVFERFGIPARFYFDAELERHAAVRYLSGVVDALLGGWDHAATLAALRLAPRFAGSNAMDRFDFDVRERIPDAGLGGLRSLLLSDDGQPRSASAQKLLHEIDSLAALEEWRSLALAPKDWAARFSTLRNLFRPAEPSEPASHELALMWRSQAAALDEFDRALEDAAQALDPAGILEIESFWQTVKAALRLRPLRVPDRRRNVVHVLSAPEARQWVLPVVFVCGMVEKQFPQFHRQDPFFPDGARRRLHEAGVRVRTAAEFESEERELFDAAITRATLLVTLSYPEFDARGERNLPSLFLEGVAPAPVDAGGAGFQPAAGRHRVPAPQITAPDLLVVLRTKTAKLSATGLESYLQCPFQYFLGKTLRLKTAPPRAAERLDFLTQGNIVHQVLARWWAERGDIGALFEEVFAEQRAEKRIPRSYYNESMRNAMRENLAAFACDARWPRPGFESQTELAFQFPLAEGIDIGGKIDRLDVAPDGQAWVTDYKYSAQVQARAENPNLLQAPLYLLAAERAFDRRAVGMEYVGLKGEVEVVGWKAPFPEGFFETAIEKTLHAVEEIRAGRVEPAPYDTKACRYCDFRDGCRVDLRAAAAAQAAEGA